MLLPIPRFEPVADEEMSAMVNRMASRRPGFDPKDAVVIPFPFRPVSDGSAASAAWNGVATRSKAAQAASPGAAEPPPAAGGNKPDQGKVEVKPGILDQLLQLAGVVPGGGTLLTTLFTQPDKVEWEDVVQDPDKIDEFLKFELYKQAASLSNSQGDLMDKAKEEFHEWLIDDGAPAPAPIFTPVPSEGYLTRGLRWGAEKGTSALLDLGGKLLLKQLGIDELEKTGGLGTRFAIRMMKDAVLPVLKQYLKKQFLQLLKDEFPETFRKLELNDDFLKWQNLASVGIDTALNFGQDELLKGLGLDNPNDSDGFGKHLAAKALKEFFLPELKAYFKDELLGYLKEFFPDQFQDMALNSSSMQDRLLKKLGLEDGGACVPVAVRYDIATHKGSITSPCSGTVKAGGIAVARQGDGFACAEDSMMVPVSEGIGNVLVEGMPIAHHKGPIGCGAKIQASGFHNVFVFDAHPEMYLPQNTSMSCSGADAGAAGPAAGGADAGSAGAAEKPAGSEPAASDAGSAPEPSAAEPQAQPQTQPEVPQPQQEDGAGEVGGDAPSSPAPVESGGETGESPEEQAEPEDQEPEQRLPNPDEVPTFSLLYSKDAHLGRNEYDYCPDRKPEHGWVDADRTRWVNDVNPFTGEPNPNHGPNSMRGLVDGQWYGFQCNYNPDGSLDTTSSQQGTFDRITFDPTPQYSADIRYPNGLEMTSVSFSVPFIEYEVQLEVPSISYGTQHVTLPGLTELPKVIIGHGLFDYVPHKLYGGDYEDRTHVVPGPPSDED